MRTLAAVLTIATALLISAGTPLRAAPWCAWFTGNDYSHDCSYYTLLTRSRNASRPSAASAAIALRTFTRSPYPTRPVHIGSGILADPTDVPAAIMSRT